MDVIIKNTDKGVQIQRTADHRDEGDREYQFVGSSKEVLFTMISILAEAQQAGLDVMSGHFERGGEDGYDDNQWAITLDLSLPSEYCPAVVPPPIAFHEPLSLYDFAD